MVGVIDQRLGCAVAASDCSNTGADGHHSIGIRIVWDAQARYRVANAFADHNRTVASRNAMRDLTFVASHRPPGEAGQFPSGLGSIPPGRLFAIGIA